MENNFFTLLEQSNNVYKKSIDFAFKNQKISHAFLLRAEINTKLDDAAYYLALKIIESYTKKLYDVDFLLNGKYMDFLELKPINNTLKKEQVTEATKLFSKSSFHTNSPKILYISNIEKGNSYSLNSLLKYLENPPKNTFIIMSTNNYKRILSTIISRSQIFEIKKKKFEFLEKLYKSENFDNSIIRFYAKIFDDKEEAKSFNSKKYWDLVNKMLIALDNSLVNKFLIIDFLEENLNKDNYYFIMQILRIFFDDVFTQQISSEVIFKKFHKTIEKYQQIQERFYEIHFFIEEFILKLKTNTNFKIQKQFFLTKIIGLYEN